MDVATVVRGSADRWSCKSGKIRIWKTTLVNNSLENEKKSKSGNSHRH